MSLLARFLCGVELLKTTGVPPLSVSPTLCRLVHRRRETCLLRGPAHYCRALARTSLSRLPGSFSSVLYVPFCARELLLLRPEVAVLEDPSAWWHYAFAVVVDKLRADGFSRTSRFPDLVKRRRMR